MIPYGFIIAEVRRGRWTDRHARPSDLELGQPVGDHVWKAWKWRRVSPPDDGTPAFAFFGGAS